MGTKRFHFLLPYCYPGAKCANSKADLAHLVEQLIRNQQVVSSILTGGSIKNRGLCEKKSHKPLLFSKIWVAIG